ncbi:hypothetical protein M9H77_34760 [Catharanthus roseus]|uniref:Uncharacterized protein n=1 Tax=Catharanthus roseus TaxID=4058 RepID=A0ACB9ZMC8_CATRO|nr:hypothetical protein M9H77_34760 [Catharanthus roseus]
MKVNTYLIFTWYLTSRTSNRRSYVTLDCDRGGANKPRKKPVVDDEEEEVQCSYPFKLKGEPNDNEAKLTEEQLIQTDAQKIYNVVAKIKKNRMQGRNTVEEVLWLSAKCVTLSSIETYNMPLLEVIGMTHTGKNFTVATTFMQNEQATTYRWDLE